MKLPINSIISKDKIIRYLLLPRQEDDKSKYLYNAGYSLAQWEQLEKDIRKAIKENEAIQKEQNPYGFVYEVKAKWKGPNGKEISVILIWIRLLKTGEIKFVTLYPMEEKK